MLKFILRLKIFIFLSSIILGAVFITAPCYAENKIENIPAYSVSDLNRICNEILDYTDTLKQDNLIAGNSSSDWLVYSRAIAGRDTPGYLSALEDYVRQKYKESGGLGVFTEYHRIVIVISALGGNPAEIENDNDTKINLLNDGIFFAEELGKQGINVYIWALIAINECGYEQLPQNEDEKIINSIDKIIYSILLSELPEGGFALNGNTVNPEITAQAVRALAPHRNNADVRKTVEHCNRILQEMKNSDGSYSSFGIPTSEATAQVIIADCNLGARKIEGLESIYEGESITALLDFYINEGGSTGFTHIKEEQNADILATAQGLEAVVKYLKVNDKYLNENTDIEDEEIIDGIGAYINIALIMVLIFILLIVMDKMAKRKKMEN